MFLLLYLIKCCQISLYVTLLNSGYFCRIIFSKQSVDLSLNIGDNRNVFLKLVTTLGLYHVLLASSEQAPKKVSLTIVEMQQSPEVGKFESENEICCLRWIIFNGRRKLCVFCKTDTDYVGNTVYRYRKNMFMKDSDIELKATEYNTLLQKKKAFKLSRNLLQKIYRWRWDNSSQLTLFCWELDVFFVVAVIQSYSGLKVCSPFKQTQWGKIYFWVFVTAWIQESPCVRWTICTLMVEFLVMVIHT